MGISLIQSRAKADDRGAAGQPVAPVEALRDLRLNSCSSRIRLLSPTVNDPQSNAGESPLNSARCLCLDSVSWHIFISMDFSDFSATSKDACACVYNPLHDCRPCHHDTSPWDQCLPHALLKCRGYKIIHITFAF